MAKHTRIKFKQRRRRLMPNQATHLIWNLILFALAISGTKEILLSQNILDEEPFEVAYVSEVKVSGTKSLKLRKSPSLPLPPKEGNFKALYQLKHCTEKYGEETLYPPW